MSFWPQIRAERWDTLVRGPGTPFVRHAYLDALHATGCVAGSTGWAPLPIALDEGAAPAWIKDHSMGEFVYDWSWAAVAERIGSGWYPKLVIASPFSPITGPRLLVADGLSDAEAGERRRTLLRTAEERAAALGCHGAHLLFCTEEEARLAEAEGWRSVPQIQHHFLNPGWRTFDDWLDTLRSKTRRNIRRERRRLREQGWTVEAIPGTEATAPIKRLVHAWYASTVDRYAWGRRYLVPGFFERLFETMPEHLLLFVARDSTGEPVAGAFTLVDDRRIYGRYWGATEQVDLLHFEVCYYALVEEALRRGLEAVEFGQGGVQKALRGFTPVRTWSAHRVFDPRMDAILQNHFRRVHAEVDAFLQASETADSNDTVSD